MKEYDWNSSIPRYVEPIISEEILSASEAITNLKDSFKAAYDAEDELSKLLEEVILYDSLFSSWH